ncbi:hypothetical protein BJY00DRAFT_311069 [Aspergillus carlsbadensis]|nr:hypothetical protein BJY00DRAFT_311069 [Aspergillus carlsbadensis]
MTPDMTDVSQHKLQYLLHGEWRDAALGIGGMAGIDFSGPGKSELNVAESYGTFASLSPGEVWESSFSMFDLDWECLGENNTGPAGDAFRLQYLGRPLEWWDYGRCDEHKETVVTVDAFLRVVSPKHGGGGGREELVPQRLNVLEASWCNFALCLYFPSQTNFNSKRAIFGVHFACFFYAVIPLLICAIIVRLDDDNNAYREWPALLVITPHMLWLTYVGTILAAVAIYSQARAILRPDPLESLTTQRTSLSVLGLAIQSVLFILLAVSWIFRLSFPPLPEGATWWDYRVTKVWFELVGSIAVDNAVFGVGQGILLLIVLRNRKGGGGAGDAGGDGDMLGTDEEREREREPLLARATYTFTRGLYFAVPVL